jgi:tetratricopeptide (TPR) repeat protein/transcriptional regulator with XRE-family HTH domain
MILAILSERNCEPYVAINAKLWVRCRMATPAEAGRLIRRARQQRGWSQQQLANKIQAWERRHGAGEDLGIDRSYISDWELGKQGISAAYAHRLRAVLGIPAEQLHTDQRLGQAATALPRHIPRQLPGDIADFTGRHRELDQLHRLLHRTSQAATGPVVISAIDGMAGIGKSALAVHVAHQISDRFPDGQLYLNLHGSTPGLVPLEPLSALGQLLRSLGVPDQHVPTDLDAAAARFRSIAAPRRLLVVLDNARDAAQVRPLLPGSPTCAVLITSRQILATLEGTHPVHLDLLLPDHAVELLGRIAGHRRIADDPQTAAGLVRLCGYLPLAIRIAGARLAARPTWPLRVMVDQLADATRRLEELTAGRLAVRAAFDISLQVLQQSPDPVDRAAAAAFGLLSLPDGPDLSLAAAARLLGQSESTAQSMLERLTDAQMLESPLPGRYRMHDLLRLFARAQADQQLRPAARRAALRRVQRWYQTTAERANHLVQPADLRRGSGGEAGGEGGAGAVQLRDRGAALAWLEAERGNLVAAAQQAARRPGSSAAVTVKLAASLFFFMQARGYWQDWEELNRLAVRVTRRLGDVEGEGRALSDLAGASYRLGRIDEAISCLRRALQIHRDRGDLAGESAVLGNLGIAYCESGRLEEAATSCEQGLRICRASGYRYGEAMQLNTLGRVYQGQGRFDAASAALEQSLSIFEELGDAWGQGNSLTNLGEVCRRAGRAEESLELCRRGLARFREVGDRFNEAEALGRLGSALDALGEHEQARAHWREALEILRAIGAPREREILRLLGEDPASA